MAGQIQNQNQRQPQSNRQAVPATGNSQPDELKGLGMMMQQLLQGMQIQGKSLNQVSTDITTRMDNMFTELNTKEQLKSFPKKELDDKSEIKEVLDGDPHAYTKKLNGDARVNEKVQGKRVKGDPTVTLILQLFSLMS
ncbi:hypothetical protein F2Q69_00028931 [Brassica cretica]|uniref:Uncharacterized protein n=1 Tax=Brassica cretica TaxID=69181 RepID=A0A8S9RS23_BRACR|nr:hypothetical protein F2Q69_00028931 [Brassica cretica]